MKNLKEYVNALKKEVEINDMGVNISKKGVSMEVSGDIGIHLPVPRTAKDDAIVFVGVVRDGQALSLETFGCVTERGTVVLSRALPGFDDAVAKITKQLYSKRIFACNESRNNLMVVPGLAFSGVNVVSFEEALEEAYDMDVGYDDKWEVPWSVDTGAIIHSDDQSKLLYSLTRLLYAHHLYLLFSVQDFIPRSAGNQANPLFPNMSSKTPPKQVKLP